MYRQESIPLVPSSGILTSKLRPTANSDLIAHAVVERYRRLSGWGYSKGASFFITITTEPRRSLFGKVEKGAMVLSPFNRQTARIALATSGGMAIHAVPQGGGVAYEDVADSAVTNLSPVSADWRGSPRGSNRTE